RSVLQTRDATADALPGRRRASQAHPIHVRTQFSGRPRGAPIGRPSPSQSQSTIPSRTPLLAPQGSAAAGRRDAGQYSSPSTSPSPGDLEDSSESSLTPQGGVAWVLAQG